MRELREETGLTHEKIVNVSMLGVNDALRADIFLIQVTDCACEGVSHFSDPDKEFSELSWFWPNALPHNIYPDVVKHIGWSLRE